MSDFLNDFLEGPPPDRRPPPPPAPSSETPGAPPRPARRALEPKARPDGSPNDPSAGPDDDYFVKSDGAGFDSSPGPLAAGTSSPEAAVNAPVLIAIIAVLAFRLGTERNFEPYPMGTAVGGAVVAGLLAYGIWRALSRLNLQTPAFVIVPLAVAVAVAAQATFWKFNPSAPTEEEVRAAFVPIEGYSYSDPPEEVVTEARRAIEQNPEVAAHLDVLEARLVQQGQALVGVVLIVGVDPDLFEESDFQDGMIETAEKQGFPARPVVVGATPAVQVDWNIGTMIMFADEEKGMLFEVVGLPGTAERTVRDVSSKLAEGNASD